MAPAAVFALEHLVHRDVRCALLHLEELRMAFAAAVSLFVIAVRVRYGESGGLVGESCQVVTVVAGVFVQLGSTPRRWCLRQTGSASGFFPP